MIDTIAMIDIDIINTMFVSFGLVKEQKCAANGHVAIVSIPRV